MTDNQLQHSFERDNHKSYCTVCQGSWPSADGIISKYYSCSKCNLCVHSSCKLLATKCYPCDIAASVPGKSPVKVKGTPLGKVYMKLMHAFDINVEAGLSLYSTVELQNTTQVLTTETSTSTENECVWSMSTGFTSHEETQHFTFNDSSSSSSAKVVRIQVYSSYMGIFSTLLASADIPLSPIFQYPDILLERWFVLANNNFTESFGKSSGKIFLSFMYAPHKPLTPTVPSANLLSAAVTAAEPTPSSAGGLQSLVVQSELLGSPASPGDESESIPIVERMVNAAAAATAAEAEAGAGSYSSVQTPLSAKRNDSEEFGSSVSSDAMTSTNGKYNISPDGRVTPTIAVGGRRASSPVNTTPSSSAKGGAGLLSSFFRTPPPAAAEPSSLEHPQSVVMLDRGSNMKMIVTADADLVDSDSDNVDGDIPIASRALPFTIEGDDDEYGDEDRDGDSIDGQQEADTGLSKTVSRALTPPLSPSKPLSSNMDGAMRDLMEPISPDSMMKSFWGFAARTTNKITNYVYELESAPNDDASSTRTSDTTGGRVSRRGDYTAGTDTRRRGSVLGSATKGRGGDTFTAARQNHAVDDSAFYDNGDGEPEAYDGSGVGTMFINLVSAFKTNVKDAAEGDHYVVLEIADTGKEYRTNSIYSSATPVFNTKWVVPMKHYRSTLRLHLVDAVQHKKIGSYHFSPYTIMHRDADYAMQSNKITKDRSALPTEKLPIRSIKGHTTTSSSSAAAVSSGRVRNNGGSHNNSGSHNITGSSGTAGTVYSTHNNTASGEGDIGYFTAQLGFEEDMDGLYWGKTLHWTPDCPQEELSVKRLNTHISRFSSVIDWFALVYTEYCNIMLWHNPTLTFIILLFFLHFTLYMDAEYALSAVMFIAVVLSTRAWYRRKVGKYKRFYVEKRLKIKAKPPDYRPIAMLRVSVLGFKNLPIPYTHTKPLVSVSYIPLVGTEESSVEEGGAMPTTATTEDSFPCKEHLIGTLGGDSRSANSSNGSSSVSDSSGEPLCCALPAPEASIVDVKQLVSNIVGTGTAESSDKSQILRNITDVWTLPGGASSAVRELDRGLKSMTAATTTKSTDNSKMYSTSHFTSSTFSSSSAAAVSQTADLCLVYPLLQPIKKKLIKFRNDQAALNGTLPSAIASKSAHSSSFSPTVDVVGATGGKIAGDALSTATIADASSSPFLSWKDNDGYLKFVITQNSDSAFVNNTEVFVKVRLRDLVDDVAGNDTILAAVDGTSSFVNQNYAFGKQKEVLKWFSVSESWEKLNRPTSPYVSVTQNSDNGGIYETDAGEMVREHPTTASAAAAAAATLNETAHTVQNSILDSHHNTSSRAPVPGPKNGQDLSGDGESTAAVQIQTPSSGPPPPPPHASMSVCLRLQLDLKSKRSTLFPTPDNQETSHALQVLLYDKPIKEGSTISVLWNLRDHVKYVQNVMNWLLDYIEGTKNIFNWTLPSRTLPVYICLVLIWLLTIFIKGRIIILLLGLYNFFEFLIPVPAELRIVKQISNYVKSIPNDDDIEQIYEEERKVYAESLLIRKTEMMRRKRFHSAGLAPVWEGAVGIRIHTLNSAQTHHSLTGNATGTGWAIVYIVLQAHRLVWWASEKEIESGKPAAGQLLFIGHAGVGPLSPMEQKQCGDDGCAFSTFGKDCTGLQQKMSIQCCDVNAKTDLYAAIEKIIAVAESQSQ